MAVYKQPKSKYWWFKFVWDGKPIRESTKQTNRRVAEQMEAARRTQLAKGEVGIRDRARVPTLAEFAEERFRPFVRATFAAKPKTKVYYENGLNNLLAFEKLADQTIDEITSELIAAYVATRHAAKLEISSINRELQVLRRMFNLANEWKVVERPLHRVRMLKGENQRDRVLTADEEKKYLRQAGPLLRDVATVSHRLHVASRGVLQTEAGPRAARQSGDPLGKDGERHVPGTDRDRAHRTIECQKVARQSVQTGEGRALRPLHISPHLSHALGSAHGRLHAPVFGWPTAISGSLVAIFTPNKRHSQSHGEGSQGSGWAYF